MTVFQLIAVLITLTALFSYVNHRFIRLPATIGVMLIALLVSLGLIGAGRFAPWVLSGTEGLLKQIDFDNTLMQGMLCFFLFADSLHIDMTELVEQKAVIAAPALAGVVVSMFTFGTLIHFALGWVCVELGYTWCLLFGALIFPPTVPCRSSES